MKFICRRIIKKRNSYSFLLFDKKKQVGSFEGKIGSNRELITAIHIDENYQGKGIGLKYFLKLYNYLNECKPIKSIVGSWHQDEEFGYCKGGMSTNLKLFLDCCLHERNNVKCAFSTPTGKWAKKLLYNKCKFLRITKQNVQVVFQKDESNKIVKKLKRIKQTRVYIFKTHVER
ncbi:MAG: hypothetical protein WCL70_01580 [Paludibacter sp.]